MKANSRPKFPLPHPIEWLVCAQMVPTHYDKIAQFRYKHDAYDFAKTVTCYHTMIIEPAMHGVAR